MPDYGDNHRRSQSEPATQGESYDESTRCAALAEHNRRETTSRVVYGGDRLKAADEARTILERELILRNRPITEATAHKIGGMTATRLKSLAEGWGTPSAQEAAALKKAFGLSADTLLSDNDADGRHKVVLERPL